jgi:cytoskeletal protein CcmA (bactofilin family)
MKPQKVSVACPRCGHSQLEPAAAYSTVCKKCGQHFRLREARRPPARSAEAPKALRRITCFACGTDLTVPPAAQSTMCKRCGGHVDLRDYRISGADSKNFKTKGRLVIEADGYLFNTDSVAGDVVIKGRFLGKLTAERSLEIHTGARLQGTLRIARLVIPAGQAFAWAEPLHVTEAEIGGELVADLCAAGTVRLKPTARLFGQVEARDLVVQSGALWVGRAKAGPGAAGGSAAELPHPKDERMSSAR